MPPPPQPPYPNEPQQPSYPNEPQPQGPYGQQPSQTPGPYGQQPPYPNQPQPQNPYAEQPPQTPGPYGLPHPQAQPYPQAQPHPQAQPYPPQQPYPGWGVPPMAPPPKKRRVGLVLGIVGGVLVLIVGGLVALGALGAAFESSFPEAKNKLTLPRTLLHGKYELTKDLSGTEGSKIETLADGAWDAKDTHGVVGSYGLGGDGTKGTLVVSGMYGRFMNSDAVRNNMMKGAAGIDGAKVAVAPKDFDLGVTITCEVLTEEQSGTKITLPMCAWADGNTGATVAVAGRQLLRQNPSDVDLEAIAKDTLEVRSETVKPIG